MMATMIAPSERALWEVWTERSTVEGEVSRCCRSPITLEATRRQGHEGSEFIMGRLSCDRCQGLTYPNSEPPSDPRDEGTRAREESIGTNPPVGWMDHYPGRHEEAEEMAQRRFPEDKDFER